MYVHEIFFSTPPIALFSIMGHGMYMTGYHIDLTSCGEVYNWPLFYEQKHNNEIDMNKGAANLQPVN